MKKILALFAIVAAAASPLSAGSLTFAMEDGDDSGGFPFNTTAFTVLNTSENGAALTRLHMTVGDPAFNFDLLYGGARELFTGGSGTATLDLGDRADSDNVVTDAFQYSFTGLIPNVSFRGQWDIDRDDQNFVADARSVLFNNGAAPNAVATFSFSDGSTIQYEFPDLPVQASYSIQIVPEPATIGLLALGVAALCLRRKHR